MNTLPVRIAKHPEISAEALLVKETLLAQGPETPMIDNIDTRAEFLNS